MEKSQTYFGKFSKQVSWKKNSFEPKQLLFFLFFFLSGFSFRDTDNLGDIYLQLCMWDD